MVGRTGDASPVSPAVATPLALAFECDPDNITMNQPAKYLNQKSFGSEVVLRAHRHAHVRQIALPGPLKWSAKILAIVLKSEQWLFVISY